MIVPENGDGGKQVALMQVTAPAEERRRHYLDLHATDQAAEVERLTSLGASAVDWDYEPDADYVVLADPDGLYFCVVQT